MAVTLGVFESVDDSLGDHDFLYFISGLSPDFVHELFFPLDDLLVLAVPAHFEVDFSLQTGDVDLTLCGLGHLLGLVVSHLRIYR